MNPKGNLIEQDRQLRIVQHEVEKAAREHRVRMNSMLVNTALGFEAALAQCHRTLLLEIPKRYPEVDGEAIQRQIEKSFPLYIGGFTLSVENKPSISDCMTNIWFEMERISESKFDATIDLLAEKTAFPPSDRLQSITGTSTSQGNPPLKPGFPKAPPKNKISISRRHGCREVVLGKYTPISNGQVTKDYAGSYVFQYKRDGNFYILPCPNAKCVKPEFNEHPLENGRAINHLRRCHINVGSIHEMVKNFARQVYRHLHREDHPCSDWVRKHNESLQRQAKTHNTYDADAALSGGSNARDLGIDGNKATTSYESGDFQRGGGSQPQDHGRDVSAILSRNS